MNSKLQSLRMMLLFVFTATALYAQSGKVSGRVVDQKTGEGLPFANVVLVGTSQGAATDVDGYYAILNVRPGTYSVKASALGYSAVTLSNIKVSIDLTSKADFSLSETSLQVTGEVIIVATKPIVTKDLTASTAIVGADDIAALPVTEFQQVLGLKAGIVGSSVRGGRSGEVVYAIDGVPVTDVYDGSTVVNVNANSIQELQFVSGAFNAEYGKALSGYVNIATKDGDDKFTGNIMTYIGDNVSNHTDIFRAIDQVNPVAIRNLEGSLSGPIIPNTLYFYTNMRYIYFDGWLKGKRVFTPFNIVYKDGNNYVVNRDGDGKIVSMNYNEKVYGQGKLTYRIMPELKLAYNYIYEKVRYRDYDRMFAYNPDGDLKRFRWSNSNILGLTHTLGSSTFYQLNFSYFFKKYQHYVYENPADPNYTNDVLLETYPYSFYTGGTRRQHFSRNTGTIGIKYDITSQVTKSHQLKGGIEFNQHQLSYNDMNPYQDPSIADPRYTSDKNPRVTPIIPDPNSVKDAFYIDVYTRKPIEFSAYLQDKIELSEMIINLGLRFDYFKSDGYLLNDPSDPDIYHPRKPENQDAVHSLAERKTYWYKKPSPKSQISPRLGIAFPITDRAVIHFSYGHFFQIPSFELLFQNPEYKFDLSTGVNGRTAGNPDLKPQSTVSGEVGLQQALTDDISIDLTGYFRDIRDLAGTRADLISMYLNTSQYAQFVNSDFGYVKGIVLTLTKRLSNNWSATIDYTLQSAKGNASDPSTTVNQLRAGQQPEIQLIPLSQDQTHTLNVTFTYANPENWGFSLIGQYGSGFPYTPTQSADVSSLLTNSETKPSTFNVDLKAYKDISLDPYRLSLFLRIQNLFDIKNQYDVYSDSGTADFTIEENGAAGKQNPVINTLDEYFRRATMYSEPRRIEVGASLYF